MFFARGSVSWYDLILLGLAGLIVYPDHVLGWISDRTGRSFRMLHLLTLAVIAAGITVLFLALVMPYEPRLRWWQPVLYVSMLGLFRMIYGFFGSLFN